MSELEPNDPQAARDWYVAEREDELAEATLRAHKYRLAPFLEWCILQDIDNMNDLKGRHFSEYKLWRKHEKGNPNNVTLNAQLCTLRVFIKWCRKRNVVLRDLYEYVDPPRMASREDVRTVTLDAEDAADVLAHLRKYEYASRDHVVMELLWTVSMREGSLVALELSDYVADPAADEEATGPYLQIRHRPEAGTPLKNGNLGQRDVSLKSQLRELLDDYVATNRVDIEDEHGRDPLITTRYGRIARQTIRRNVYGFTRPCVYSGSCPDGRDISECASATDKSKASHCPASVSPHAVRKGAIT